MAASPFRRRSRAVLIGGALIAVGAAALANRNRVAGLIGARSSVPEPPPPPAPPAPSNYDLSGPAANTATPVPAPDPVEPEAVDEQAEVEAAAAEAAAIGGEVSDYAAPEPDRPAAPEEIPLAEAGEGDSEGQEQAEAALAENAEPPDGEIPGQTRIDELIEDQPSEEVPPQTPSTPETPAAGDPAERAEEQARQDDDGPSWQTWSGIGSRP